MSLLLDALKRAEQAQLAKQVQPLSRTSESDALSGQPGSVPHTLPHTVSKESEAISLELVPAEPTYKPIAAAPLMATSTPSAQPAEKDDRAQREAALNMFTAKQAANSKRNSLAVFAGIGAFIAMGVALGGWYLWSTFTRTNPSSPSLGATSATTSPATALAANAAVPSPAAMLPPARPDTGQPGNRADPPTEARLAQVIPASPPPMLADPSPPPGLRDKPLPSRDAAVKTVVAPLATREPAIALKPVMGAPRASVNLSQAYAALKGGDYLLAQQHYMQILRNDSLNLDACLGLAVVAERSGNSAEALRHYRRALEIDPRNAHALAGLLTIGGTDQPETIETELKALLIKNPQSGALQFSLGNLYATNARWTEAQQAYFEAFRLEPGNADYLHNLAVSLDQLNQPRLALGYYRKARQAFSRMATPPFDIETIAQRIAVLQQDVRD